VVEKIEDIKDIMGYGVMSTPGVVIDDKVVHADGNRYMDIEFLTEDGAGTSKYHVKGMVVHSASDGVGLMIDDFDPDGRLQMQTSQIR